MSWTLNWHSFTPDDDDAIDGGYGVDEVSNEEERDKLGFSFRQRAENLKVYCALYILCVSIHHYIISVRCGQCVVLLDGRSAC